VKNPWIRLPTNAPFVLPEDAPLIERRNRGAPEETRIETDLIPEPFLGNPDAPILLLNLNPGYDPREVPLHTSEPTFIALSRANLSHEVTQYPFYLLDPSVDRSLGHQWWLRKLASLIESAGAQALAESLFCAEYFPYHSRRYRHSPTLLPSQFYTFELARRSAAKAKAIVLMRGARYWLQALPSLGSDPRVIRLRSVQNVAISPRNCGPAYADLEAAVLPRSQDQAA
jgi:hypothetical protein